MAQQYRVWWVPQIPMNVTAKKPLTQTVLDMLIEPAWWLIQWSQAWLVDALARVHPHRMSAGFNDTVDALRLGTIRAKLARGQKVLTAHDGWFLLAVIDGRLAR